MNIQTPEILLEISDERSELETTHESTGLPAYWRGADFYLLGLQQGDDSVAGEPDIDLSAYEFESPRMIWILMGDRILNHLPHIFKRLNKRSRALIMLHPELMEGVDWKKLFFLATDDRFYIVPIQDVAKQAQTINGLMDDEKFDGWKPVVTSIANGEWIVHYRQLVKEMTPLLNRKLVRNATNKSATHQILCNALINMPLTSSSNKWEDYKDIYLHKPALIISTGPSLNKQLELIKKFSPYFVTIAVDPAVPILKEQGITPDFVLTIDPRKRPYWEQDALDDETTYVVEIGACPDSTWSHSKKYLMTAGHGQVYALIKKLGGEIGWILTGGSVSTNAFSLAKHLGCNPIVLVGQDLAWTEGKDHAEGYSSQYSSEALKRRYDRGYDIVGYGGQTVRTEPQLLYYKSWFEQQIKSNTNLTVINATEGGAIIDGALSVPFAHVCEEVAKLGIVEKNHSITKSFELNHDLIQQYQIKITEWTNIYTELKKNILEVQKKIKKISEKPKKSLQNQVKRVNQMIVGLEPDAKVILDMFANLAMCDINSKLDLLDEAKALKTIYSAYDDLYKSVLFGLDYGLEMLPKVNKLFDELSTTDRISRKQLIENNLNRWTLDGVLKN